LVEQCGERKKSEEGMRTTEGGGEEKRWEVEKEVVKRMGGRERR